MKSILLTFFIMSYSIIHAQIPYIKGQFPNLANQHVKLFGYRGFDTYLIDSKTLNEKGVFQMTYDNKDLGVGFLVAKDNKPFLIVLSGEDIQLKGKPFDSPRTIKIIKGKENQLFEQYATEHPKREQALSAWDYLEKIYLKDSVFSIHEIPKQAIAKEKQRIFKEDSLFWQI